ncbi:cell division protein DedD [Serratia proteamaculans]|uniref:Cell division protein DedD n=1 Tax=Serratia proteamaculans TaxID=28151 RepID=A0ABS0TRQ7_SERPR|nr:cell division protein DedD [Serratia proteamaculans]MBI6180005.1 cell division protein DedD [Serratia proteamaculans]RYM48108.1 cell division protein DedD [Serratia proteamaculans]RYM50497.1 cell division protein DedD [Serratia proteamaculans]CAI0708899.1 cell division protein DedD [Serratia proteamaculans]CAI2038630.1 cell division protein DedD [Serratia proteamaculans]
MASKFQNRLVGTVILVALGVIILPGLLDGKKKHYEDEFAAIPLVPKAGDVEENDVLPPVSQPLPAQPPEGAGALVEQQAANEAAAQQAVRQPTQQPTLVTPPPVETRPQPTPQPKPKPVEVKPKPVQQPKPVEVKPVEVKPVVKPETRPEPKPEPTPEPAPVQKPAEEKAPAGQAYVVQLGALKNAAKVNEVVASLRLSGYRAFTVPSTPVQGQITRIYVGPDASKQKLQSSLSALNSISGLSGQVKPYGVR